MKTNTDLNSLIQIELDAIRLLDNEKRRGGASYEEWASRQKIIRRERAKRTEEIKHLRRLIVFVERTSEDGVRMMHDKLQREVDAATATAHRLFERSNAAKGLIKEYLTTVGIPLKKRQIKELKFLLA